MAISYKHSYEPISMYGNVIALLRQNRAPGDIHLDIGCGYGAIAEPIRDELGITYLGFDLAEDGLESLRSRGFEVHAIDLAKLDDAEAAIKRAAAGRTIASISFLDTMEHITNGPDVLAMLRRLAEASNAPLVISVPNITHKDVALKLLMGRLDITETGILDFTHVAMFSSEHLKRVTLTQGWREIGANDWLLEHSDQFFPSNSPFLDPHTVIGQELRSLIAQANENILVNQFVRIYSPSVPQPMPPFIGRDQPSGPFLSVVVDAFTASHDEVERLLSNLAQQTSDDFNVILVVNASEQQETTLKAIELAQDKFQERLRVVKSSQSVRAIRLNEAVAAADGRFIAIVIEFDQLEPSWASSFTALETEQTEPVLCVGRVAPETAASQETAVAPDECIFPVSISGHESIAEWAIPSRAITDIGIRFDPGLGAAELRDFVIQSALLCGVLSSSTQAVSRYSQNTGSPSGVVSDEDHLLLLTKLNAYPLLLPPKSAERIERLINTSKQQERMIRELSTPSKALRIQTAHAQAERLERLIDAGKQQERMICELSTLLEGLTAQLAQTYQASESREKSLDKLNAQLEKITDRIGGPLPAQLRQGEERDQLNAQLQEFTEDLGAAKRLIRFLADDSLLARFIADFDPQALTGINIWAEPKSSDLFLSVIIRTGGSSARINTLREGLLTLAGQSSQNFEILLVVHGDQTCHSAVSKLVAEFPSEFSRRIKLLHCTRPGRSAPLNCALEHIKGQYVAVFDDDDLLFGHWVETFQRAAEAAPGSMLRSVATRQDFKTVKKDSCSWPKAESWFLMEWPSAYDAVEHLRTNFTPFMSMAFPATVFTQLGLRFDEGLSTAEDWQLSTRVAMICGVTSVPDVTAVYRWWTNGGSSLSLHPPEEWIGNRQRILRDLNEQAILLPPGSTEKIVALIDEVHHLRNEAAYLRNQTASLQETVSALEHRGAESWPMLSSSLLGAVDPAQSILRDLIASRSWRVTKPLRKFVNTMRRVPGSGITFNDIPTTSEAAHHLIQNIQDSASWRVTRPLRVVGTVLRRLRSRN